MAKEVLYLKIAKIMEEQILSKTLRIGDKLPSIRSIQKIYNVSLNTAKQAFLKLESKSLIESRPRTGYYVSNTSQRKLALPSISKPRLSEKENTPEDLTHKVFDALRNKDIRQFSLGVPDGSLLPIAKLNKGIIKAMQHLDGSGTAFEPAQGSINLRRNIAKWSLELEGKLTEDDIVTTLGTMNAIYYCLNAATKPGDTIATESPVYFGILQLAKSMRLNVIELPTHPVTGVDIDALKKNIHKINAVCLITNFSNPLGSLMPDESKKLLIEMLTFYNIPLIEDDLFGNLFLVKPAPNPARYLTKPE
ncbi:PLP-dependent aminotransferase family protein [Mucilaginibacter angelicae]|uniref:PLP-dependent aminotransferase family protein n=1 Tax=Mucilaginibacter angelicae TaxID=869718 RepID=A0ABV6LCZ9_9SPHI